MAKGRAIGRFEAFLGLIGILALVVTYAVITGWNPLPGFANWLDKARTLSEPAPVWRIQVGDQPSTAVVSTHAVIISSRGTVQARDLATGGVLWSRDVDWSAVAGTDGSTVVIAGRTGRQHGYEALDPDTGAVRWSAADALGVWTFTNLVVDVTCPESMSCTLIARSPTDGAVRWRSTLSGNGRTLAGANTPLSGVRPLGVAQGGPIPVPPLLGFLVDDQVQVIATGDGRRLHAYRHTQTTRVVVAGPRVIITTALWRDGNCRYSVDARDPDGDRRVWHLDGYDLHTSSGMGCAQRDDPLGGGGLLAATGPDNRDVLIDSATGAIVYHAPAGQEVVATDGTMAVTRAEDHKKITTINVKAGGQRWNRTLGSSARVAIAGPAVLVTDPGASRLVAVRADGGQVLVQAKTGATVLGYASTGLVINIGRSVGLLGYTSPGSG